MKIEIEIPQEFEEHFIRDKFEDTLHRLSADAHLIAGNYEQETAIMLIKAFKESKTAYDVDKVAKQLEKNAKYFQSEADELAQVGGFGTATELQGKAAAYRDAVKTVKSGGIE